MQKSYPRRQLKAYESLEEVGAKVEKGQADAAIVPHSMTAYYLINHKESNLQMVGKVFASEPDGIAVKKGNQELMDKLNRSLEMIKAFNCGISLDKIPVDRMKSLSNSMRCCLYIL